MTTKKQDLKNIEWLLKKEDPGVHKIAKHYNPEYGDVTKFNTEHTIIDHVDRKTLEALSEDIMDLLDTSIAVYEKNGDYAYGQFDSTWCQLMDSSSFKLCGTNDLKEALNCGEWLCHENCWNDSAKEAIKTGKPTDIQCVGGIHLYGEPIKVGQETIGCINMGYGNPPQDKKTLTELAKKYKIKEEELLKRSKEYKPRPTFIIENAKKRLKTVALLIGQIVENTQHKIKYQKINEELATQNEEYQNINEELRQTNEELYKAKENLQKSEELLNTTGSMAKVGGWELNLETNKIEWTKTTREIHEVPEDYKQNLDEAIEFYPGEAKEQITNLVNRALTEGTPFDEKLPFVTAKGRNIWVHAIGNPVFKNGKCIRLNGTFQDITESYIAQLELNEQEKVLKRTEQIANVGSWEWDIKTDTVTWSDELFRIFKVDPKKGAVSYADHPKIYTPESLKKEDEAVQKAVKTGEEYDVDLDIIRPDGEIRHCVSRGYAQKDEKGKVVKLYGSFQDVTKRKKIEEESANNLDKFQNLFSSIRDAIIVADKNREMIECNHAFSDLFGYSKKEIIGKQSSYIYKDHKEYEEMGQEIKKKMNKPNFLLTVSYKKKSGKLFPGETNVFYLKNAKGEIQGFIGLIRDISERLKAESELTETLKKLKDSEERFKALHNASFGGISIHDKGLILDCNQGLADITGYTVKELIGMDGLDLVDEGSKEVVMHNILSEYEKPYEVTGLRKNGEKYPLRMDARMIPYNGKRVRVVEFRDITEQKKQIHELELINRAAVGREERMIELKKEINKLNIKLGLTPPYRTDIFDEN